MSRSRFNHGGSRHRLAPALAALMAASLYGPAHAQELESYRLHARVSWSNDALDDDHVMVSWISGGRLLYQTEVRLAPYAGIDRSIVTWADVSPGLYDVRVEGEGVVTEVKRGMQITDRSSEFQFALEPGRGLHVVEYSSGALAREEVAARLGRLEGIVAGLPPEMTGLGEARAPDEACCRVAAIDTELGLATAMDVLTGRTVLFALPEKTMLADVRVGDKVWVDQTGNVGFDPADPCCIVRHP